MNNNYYNQQNYKNDNINNVPNQYTAPTINTYKPISIGQQLFAKNIGKMARFYMTFNGSKEYTDKIFEGIIEEVTNEYTIISNPNTGMWYMLVSLYINFIEFDEPMNLLRK